MGGGGGLGGIVSAVTNPVASVTNWAGNRIGGSVGDTVKRTGDNVNTVTNPYALGGKIIGNAVGGETGELIGRGASVNQTLMNAQAGGAAGAGGGIIPAVAAEQFKWDKQNPNSGSESGSVFSMAGGDQPYRPGWDSQIGGDGLLRQPYRLTQREDVKLNTQGLDALRSRALSTDSSPWAKLAEQKQQLDQSGAMDQAAAQSAGQSAQALDSLAQNGGLSEGARERIATAGARSGMFANQQIARQGMGDRLGIKLQDEQQKANMLSALPGQELAALEPDFRNRQYQQAVEGTNINAALNEIQQKRAADLDKYNAEMSAWGAARTANATAQAQPKPGLFGQLTNMFNF